MGQDGAHSVLAQLLRKAGDAAVTSTVTPTRALRLSMARAAERSVGLYLSVGDVTLDVQPLEDCLALLPPDYMLLALSGDGGLRGLAGFDLQLRTATVELQTVGDMRSSAAAERKITATDAALCGPLVTQFLADLCNTAVDTVLDGWADGIAAGHLIQDTRAAGMMLRDRDMRVVRLKLILGAEGREAELVLVLPSGKDDDPASDKPTLPTFSDQMKQAVMDAPSDLHAVLHRFELPLQSVEAFSVGQVIGLPGVTVSSVHLEASDGSQVGQARLGQVTGLRAVRIETANQPEMSEAAIDAQSQNHFEQEASELPAMAPPGINLIEAEQPDFGGMEPMGFDAPGADLGVSDAGGFDPLSPEPGGFDPVEPDAPVMTPPEQAADFDTVFDALPAEDDPSEEALPDFGTVAPLAIEPISEDESIP